MGRASGVVRSCGVAAVVIASLTGQFSLPAQAVDTSGSGVTHVGAAAGNAQTGSWNLGQRKVSGTVQNGSTFSTDRCADIKFDWNVPDTSGHHNHYDARVLRNCSPGSSVSTSWVEPSDWDGPNSNGVREVAGYLIDDDNPGAMTSFQFFVIYGGEANPDWMYPTSGETSVYTTIYGDVAPSIGDSSQSGQQKQTWSAWVYTKKQNGSITASYQSSRPESCPRQPSSC